MFLIKDKNSINFFLLNYVLRVGAILFVHSLWTNTTLETQIYKIQITLNR